ncbi:MULTISPECIES: diaminobutyrate acetyltransferase [Streptomyces]|uniref:diaminobutyrate acetyltransferase n=2 Tax=Streptomyces TaxID=1883 RepID=UPI0004C22A43|nr:MULTISPECIES: diaminobutyrate acetyltransferase [Streptomyces]MDW4918679.1 diaminobutyrate acetyltransferase [Streptomyces californicus]MYW80356.1 diaminobutyrate acetyltransferase [Streptomyces sp. SID8369]QRV59563.1 diaminobutyrate acetyltransferase [Streptomyces californicus]SDE36457.1 L-2,4-diaminobutyric acid acetyltransferase [Streptomyces sp. LaPpAH-199]
MPEPTGPHYTLREPRVTDAPAVWELVQETEILDTNSAYYYNLWFRDFASTSVVATDETGLLAGFVTAYIRPDAPDTLMAWQSAVAPTINAPGLAVRMMNHLADQAAQQGVTVLETTINPGNRAVAMMLRKLARDRGLEVQTDVLFAGEDLPTEDGHLHPPEILYRMAPTPAEPTAPPAPAAAVTTP